MRDPICFVRKIDACCQADDDFAMQYLEEGVNDEQIKAAIRKNTLKRTFTPVSGHCCAVSCCKVMMGSALKNTGIQLLLDGVISFLPNPKEVCIGLAQFVFNF